MIWRNPDPDRLPIKHEIVTARFGLLRRTFGVAWVLYVTFGPVPYPPVARMEIKWFLAVI